MGDTEVDESEHMYRDYENLPNNMPTKAKSFLRGCLPFWAESTDKKLRKNYKVLYADEVTNTRGHIRPILEQYFFDYYAGYSAYSDLQVKALSLHDYLEDASIDSPEDRYKRLDELKAIGVGDDVLAVILTCSKDMKDENGEKYSRERNFLNSLSSDYTIRNSETGTEHALKMASKLLEYGFIKAEE